MDTVRAFVEKVVLLPRFSDWREKDGLPELAYRVQVSIPVPVGPGVSEEVRGDIWIPVDIEADPVTGEEKVPGLGIESSMPMIPTSDVLGAEVLVMDGKVALKDGKPVLCGKDTGKSHWACARLVPVCARSVLELTGVSITPKLHTDGMLKGEPKMTQFGQQIVGVSSDDWHAVAGTGLRKAGSPAQLGFADKTAHVPQGSIDHAAERAAGESRSNPLNTMSEALFQTALAEILERHGSDVTDDPVRLRNLLRDYCTSEKCRREVNVTVICAKNGLLALIGEPDERTPPEARLSRFVGILHEDYGIEQSFARDVVGIWMEAYEKHRGFLELLCTCGFSLTQIEDPAVQNKLGACYSSGESVQQDSAAAVRWYLKAAEQGDIAAQRYIAGSYHLGLHVAKDDAEAVKWYRKAAEQGDIHDQSKLGYCYFTGEGVPQDVAEAVKWSRKAAEQGDASAQCLLGLCYDHGLGGAQDKAEAVKWFRMAAEQGDLAAQSMVEYDQEEIGVQTEAAAVKEYRKAAEQGDAKAQFNLGFCYRWGDGAAQDRAEAVKWYRKAAEQGMAAAQNILGFCYEDGTGVARDYAEALKWFRKAAEQGYFGAQQNFYECSVIFGVIISQDKVAEPKRSIKAGEVETIDLGGGVKMDLVWCAPGSFTMGSPSSESDRDDDETQHQVTLTKGFWIGKYEVTQAQWEAVMGSNPSRFKQAGKNAPVETVSWNDSQEFIRKVNQKVPGDGFRLPTEAEWEYAARGGAKSRGFTYSGGNDMDAVGWYTSNSRSTTHPVGQKAPNELGLYDMSGNVWEWCADWYRVYPAGSGSDRVLRGGSWNHYARYCRSAFRSKCDPGRSIGNLGLRLARSQPYAPPSQAVQTTSEPLDRAVASVSSKPTQQVVAALKQEVVRGPSPGQPWTVPDLGLVLIPVAAGSFRMGSENGESSEKPVRTVRITRDLWMGKTEVTQAEYLKVTGRSPSNFKGGDLPVDSVSWDDAVAFCDALTKRERQVGRVPSDYAYRLPTEAEWEYAARGGSKSKGFTYSGGDDVNALAWYWYNSVRRTHPVGQKPPNELGLCDMSGNVWEWCHDWHQDSYSGLQDADPRGPSVGSIRVLRGGCWDVVASNCRSAKRSGHWPSLALFSLGFRVVLAPVPSPEQPSPEKPSLGQPWTVPDLGLVLIPVAAGSFRMGSENGGSSEKPVRTVRITRDFWMGKTEVTQAQYRKVTGKSPSYSIGDDLPVEEVSWNDAVAFCEELTRRERAAGRLSSDSVYRLPTEAEWEYAARGGIKSRGFKYSGGNDLDAAAWYEANSEGRTHPVGTKTANELGLHDMSGNVWEWCYDWYQDSYSGLPDADPKGSADGADRVYRGGSWIRGASGCRSAARFGGWPSGTYGFLGFRVVLAPVP